jgi:hypothetical protein
MFARSPKLEDRADRKEISQWLILGRSLIAGEDRRRKTNGFGLRSFDLSFLK